MQEHKKIVYIVRDIEGGIKTHLTQLIKHLSFKSFSFYIITDHSSKKNAIKLVGKNNVYTTKIPKSPSIFDFFNIIRINKFVKLNNSEIIHGHGAKGGLYARCVKKRNGVKIFYTPHGGSLHFNYGAIKNYIYKQIEKFCAWNTDIFIFESKYSLQQFRENVSKKYHSTSFLIYNGVEIFPITNRSYQRDNFLRMKSFGLLRHLKGHDILISAMSLLLKKMKNFTLEIYGEGEELTNLQKQIQNLKLNENIKILPFVENIQNELKNCDLVIHPSRFESFGYVPLEAMASGIPVIASYTGGMKEFLNNKNAIILYKNSPNEIFNKIMAIVNNEYNLEQIRTEAHNMALLNFDIKISMAQMERIYKDL